MGGDYRGPHADCGHLRHELQEHAGVRPAVRLSDMHCGDACAGRRPLSLVQEDKVAVMIAAIRSGGFRSTAGTHTACEPYAGGKNEFRTSTTIRAEGGASSMFAAHPFTVETRTAEVWKAGHRRSRRPR